MKCMIKIFTGLLLATCASQALHAATINYTLRAVDDADITTNIWEYDFSITSATALAPNTGFTVYFDINEAQDLTIGATPAGWNALAIQPGSFIGDPNSPGFYDALSENGLDAGVTLSGFILQVDWLLGDSPPLDRDFETYTRSEDANDNVFLTPLASGTASVVPLPAAVWLFAGGLAGLLTFARRKV